MITEYGNKLSGLIRFSSMFNFSLLLKWKKNNKKTINQFFYSGTEIDNQIDFPRQKKCIDRENEYMVDVYLELSNCEI